MVTILILIATHCYFSSSTSNINLNPTELYCLVTREEYAKISDIKQNPQINHIKYDTFKDEFQIDTKDDFHFKVKIKK